jgi:hypothetical protein
LNNLLVYFHIPRTGGTFFNHAVGDYLSRDHWLTHYNYTENSSIMNLQNNDIPMLINRTKEQNKQLKILSGHSITNHSHKWIKTTKNPFYYTIVREPVERLLSSFNYKVQKTKLWQDPRAFAYTMPQLDSGPLYEGKTYSDYNTLFEYYLDNTIEQNIQAKWLVKGFYEYDLLNRGFKEIDHYIGSSNMLITDNKQTIPDWFIDPRMTPSKEIIDRSLEKLWWASDFNNLEKDTKKICKLFEIEYNSVEKSKQNSSRKIEPYWTIDDVKSQPDYDMLVNLLSLDYYLYEKVKLLRSPNDLPSN